MRLRQSRMADRIRDVLAKCFLSDQMRDPRLDGITITAVKLSRDLQVAAVYFRTYQDGRQDKALQGLRSACGLLRKKLGQEIDVRRIPELKFFFDESVERASRIEELLATM